MLVVEPSLSPVWAWAVHGEAPGGLALASGGLILGATLIRTLREGLRPRTAPVAAPPPARAAGGGVDSAS